MPPILVTFFEPFGGAAVNASAEVGRLLAAADSRIRLVALPVVRYKAAEIARAALAETGNDVRLVVSLGESNRPEVSLEKVAINYDAYEIPDNAGNQPRDEAILPGGPDAAFSTLPLKRIFAATSGQTPVPVRISLSAGTFLCNHVAYQLGVVLRGTGVAYGFVHVPAVRDEAPFSIADVAATVRVVLDAAALAESESSASSATRRISRAPG